MPATKKNKKATAPAARKAKKPAASKSAGGKKARTTKPTPAAETPAPPKQTTVNITEAKGRPMLSWVGKRPLRHVTAFPAQHIESFNPVSEPADKGGLLFHGDNKEVMAHLLANGYRGQINLFYIDPPFDSGANYVRKVSLRGPKSITKFDGETYTLGEQIQYTDIWANDNYLQFMYERLMMMKELLADDGAIYLHCDSEKGHFLKCIMDEIFGSSCFIHEVIWYYSNKITDSQKRIFQRSHDNILGYSKSKSFKWNTPFEKRPETVRNKKVIKVDGRRVNARDEQGKLIYVETDVKAMLDVWDIPIIGSRAEERAEYPTQKPEAIIKRLIQAHTNPGDCVADIFLGSGTTVDVAQIFGRRWIGCDINKGAIQTTAKRLQNIIAAQIESQKAKRKQQDLIAEDKEKLTPPAQLSFAVHRVNDYDLAIQHNEAVNLACEHIGITRTRSDSFFDGSIGQRLAKNVPFGHPLSVPDLEDLKKELEARPDEERGIVVVCLGKELAVEAWLEEWNRFRKRRAGEHLAKSEPNKIEVIELRTDPKYGKFIAHQPARAKVDIARKADKLVVEIKDFISPSIIERLQSQAGLLQPKIDDWRAMVDCVMIDPAHNGKVFNIALADVPEKKTDFVQARYELDAPKGKTTVAVKITDMLGEEVVVTKEI